LRDRQAERLGSLEIDDQLERGGILDRQIGRLGAVEDLVGVDGDLAVEVAQPGPVTDETPRFREF
jgi:hypothetical protein